jgi:MFS family permease
MADTDPSGRREATPLGRTTLGVVFATILIDFIGFSVLFPVLPLFAERLGATPFQVGLIVTLYALAQLVFLPVWGWISDRVGRRPVLLISLLGTTGSFLLLAAADSIGGIYLARALAGFFAASIGTAQAVVTDVTPPSERAGGMGIIGAAFGAGMVVGPMLGGSLAHIWGIKAPFYLRSTRRVGATWPARSSRRPYAWSWRSTRSASACSSTCSFTSSWLSRSSSR